MKLSKEELLKKVNEMEIEEEKKVELIEDISDSMEVEEKVDDGYKEKYDELLIKYKERFFEPKAEEKDEDVEEEKKEKVIDVTDI